MGIPPSGWNNGEMAIPGDGEVLEQGGLPSDAHRRRLRLLVALVLIIGVTGGIVDWQARRHQSAAVTRCVEVTTDAVASAIGRVVAMSRYVQPILSAAPPPRLRRGMLSMISESAEPGPAKLDVARRRCASTDVWRVHSTLHQTRDDCLRLLDGQADYLTDVAADGVRAFGGRSVRRGGCEPD